jgi:hypothetical protein
LNVFNAILQVKNGIPPQSKLVVDGGTMPVARADDEH